MRNPCVALSRTGPCPRVVPVCWRAAALTGMLGDAGVSDQGSIAGQVAFLLIPGPMRLLAQCLLLPLAFISRPLYAQVELVPYVGFYAPTSDFKLRPLPPYTGFGLATGKQETGILLGGQARVWVTPRFGFQVGAAHAASDLKVSRQFTTAPDTSIAASLTILTFGGLVRFPVSALSNPIWGELGAAVVRRQGEVFDAYDNPRTVGGMIGLGTGLGLTNRLRADISFRGIIYKFGLQDSLGTLPSQMHVDLMAHVGLSLQLGGQRENAVRPEH